MKWQLIVTNKENDVPLVNMSTYPICRPVVQLTGTVKMCKDMEVSINDAHFRNHSAVSSMSEFDK